MVPILSKPCCPKFKIGCYEGWGHEAVLWYTNSILQPIHDPRIAVDANYC